ncbi:Calcium channel flower [Schistosoma japonicum]|nr:Calcium channel flower [Schistosoma japonicum]
MAISPKLIEYGLKAAGIATAVLCFSMGVVCLISISAQCIVGGLLLILIGIVVIILEAPICCSMVPQLHKFNEFIEKRSPIEKSIFYGIAAILPLSLCFGISTLFCGLALGACCAFNVWRIIKERLVQSLFLLLHLVSLLFIEEECLTYEYNIFVTNLSGQN